VQERRRERAEYETERDKAVTRAQELATRVGTLELVHEEAAGAVEAVQVKLDELEERQPPLPAHALEHPVEAYADTQRAAGEVGRLEQVLAQAPTEEEVAAAALEAEELGRQVYRAEQAAEAGAAAREAAARAQRAVVDAQNKLVGARGELEQLDREVARYEATLERHQQAGEEAALAEAMLAGARERVATLELAVRAYGRDGVPALILEAAALPQLEAEANRLVGELGRPYRFELRSTRTTQAGEQREALDIVVHTESGEAAYEEFSGGERTRLDLALRIALARLLAARRGADVQLLAIDEPAYLDAEGFHRLAGALRSLASEFGTVLVVSHVAELRDAFDQVLEVVGGADTGEPSRLQEEVGA
jgi:exonuclease SbcC